MYAQLILSLARRVKNLAAQSTARKQASRCRGKRFLCCWSRQLTAFWLMQFFFGGAMPWRSIPVRRLRRLDLSRRGSTGSRCGLFGHVARSSSVLLHLQLAGACTANYFVSNFRGAPSCRWDFSAPEGAAAAVADGYQFAVTCEMVVGTSHPARWCSRGACCAPSVR